MGSFIPTSLQTLSRFILLHIELLFVLFIEAKYFLFADVVKISVNCKMAKFGWLVGKDFS